MQRIAFDIGNVLVHVDLKPFYDKLLSNGLSFDWTNLFLKCNERLDFTGICNLEDALLNTGKLSKQNVEDIVSTWNSCIKFNPIMINFLQSLHFDGFKIALLSNIGPLHRAELERLEPDLFKLIDVTHYSYECGVAKPARLFFQSFLMQHDDYAGCVYLDDRIENIQMASSCKFNCMLFDLDQLSLNQPPSKLKLKLKQVDSMLFR